MPVQFQSNDLTDLYLYSGVEVDYKESTSIAVHELKGEAQDKAMQELFTSYSQYKQSLHFSYGKFLGKIEANIEELNSPRNSSEQLISVAGKLEELADKRIRKENRFSGVHRFFHKIGQLFQGHGFRTKGEWGKLLANRIKEMDRKMFKSRVEQLVFGEIFRDKLQKGIEKINQLSKGEFKEALHSVFFRKNESISFGKKNKLIIFNNLNNQKKKIFEQELLKRRDWFSQAADIIEGADREQIKQFVTESMVKRFEKNSESTIGIYNRKKSDQFGLGVLFRVIAERAIKDYLSLDNTEGNLKLGEYINDRSGKFPADKILNEPLVLTPEEIGLIKERIEVLPIPRS